MAALTIVEHFDEFKDRKSRLRADLVPVRSIDR